MSRRGNKRPPVSPGQQIPGQETSGRGSPGPGSDERALPLAGLTVVALEQAVAAPFATRQLADLGARVIKVERPQGGDFARGYDRAVHGESSYFVWLNRGKESLTVDFKQHISATEPLRTGSYSKTLTFTLSTTTP